MTAPIRPASSKNYGKDKWVFVPTIADITIPTIGEVNAAGGLDVSCMLFKSTTRPSQNTNLVSREERLCDTQVFQQVGSTTYGGGTMLAALDDQAAALANGVKAWEKFPEGTVGFFVNRRAIAVATDMAVGQFVHVYPVEFGPPMPVIQGDGEAAENAFTSMFAITSTPAFRKAITA